MLMGEGWQDVEWNKLHRQRDGHILNRRLMFLLSTLLICIIVPLDFPASIFFSLVCYEFAVCSLFWLSSFHLALILILHLLQPLQRHKLFILCWPLSFLHCCSRFAELISSWIRLQFKPLNPVLLKITFPILASSD